MKTKIEGVNIEIPDELIKQLQEQGLDPLNDIRGAILGVLREKGKDGGDIR